MCFISKEPPCPLPMIFMTILVCGPIRALSKIHRFSTYAPLMHPRHQICFCHLHFLERPKNIFLHNDIIYKTKIKQEYKICAVCVKVSSSDLSFIGRSSPTDEECSDTPMSAASKNLGWTDSSSQDLCGPYEGVIIRAHLHRQVQPRR